MNLNNQVMGWVGILLSVACFAMMPFLAKQAYGAGLSPLDLLMIRFLTASALMELLFYFLPREDAPDLPSLGRMAALGLIYGLVATFLLLGLSLLSANLFSVIYYTFPVWVTLLSVLFQGYRPAGRFWLALGLNLTGLVIVLGSGPLEGNAGGIAAAFMAALLIALFYYLQPRLLAPGHSLLFHIRIMFRVMAVLFLVVWSARQAPPASDPEAWLWGLSMGVLSSFIGITALVTGIRLLGSARSALLSSQEPAWTLGLNALLLGESMAPFQYLGVAGILAAGVLMALPQGRRLRRWRRMERSEE